MKCDELQLELVSYHFGAVAEQSRAEVEAHLLSCGTCLRSFLDLKREIETSKSGPRPSPAARGRLRSAVARRLDESKRVRAWSWWERPLAFGLAAAAVVAATVTTRVVTSAPGVPPRGLESPATLELSPAGEGRGGP